ncbi:sugar ABC transporter ATP-binding protein [Sphingobacterium suaedae]|uniref:Sugar ABC transporter ATP-binding protein n=1 Tax=Sphingobacterium suaedae TaxID=1686402 RepID=A0ABW5KI87_9SPHI
MLQIKNITKRFPGVVALQDISLEIKQGEVLAVIGENGAGKSTLMKILSGVYSEYEGEIKIDQDVVRFASPREAEEAGIAIIHQELNLIPSLSITENIFLGRELLTSWGSLDKKRMRRETAGLLAKLRLMVDPDMPIQDLKVGQQQVVEMAKALLVESKIIIMDEPTSAISDNEVKVLFDIIQDLRNEGKAIIYISHKLEELFHIADSYVVLRDGRMIEHGKMAGMQTDDVIQKMVGRKITLVNRGSNCLQERILLQVKNLYLKRTDKVDSVLLDNINLCLYSGEILGIFGLMGAGRTELMETLFGQHPRHTSGEIYVNDIRRKIRSAADATRSGIALVPEDRKKDGLILGLDVKKNIELTTLKDLESAIGLLDMNKEQDLADLYITNLRIKTSSCSQLAGNLSGGNQQKIVLAKWLATHPTILLLDEPTRGIDIHAKNEIYKLMISLAEKGIGIIMVSSELPEILAVSDRILVMAEGKITAELRTNEVNEADILKAAIPKT